MTEGSENATRVNVRPSAAANPGRDVQRVGTANFLGQDVTKIHDPVWAVLGNLGDSQCYLGVQAKVDAVQEALSRRITEDGLAHRLIAPAFTVGVSDGQLNGTPQMRFSLIGRELVNDVAATRSDTGISTTPSARVRTWGNLPRRWSRRNVSMETPQAIDASSRVRYRDSLISLLLTPRPLAAADGTVRGGATRRNRLRKKVENSALQVARCP